MDFHLDEDYEIQRRMLEDPIVKFLLFDNAYSAHYSDKTEESEQVPKSDKPGDNRNSAQGESNSNPAVSIGTRCGLSNDGQQCPTDRENPTSESEPLSPLGPGKTYLEGHHFDIYDRDVLNKFTSDQIDELQKEGLVTDELYPIFSTSQYSLCKKAVETMELLYKQHLEIQKLGGRLFIFDEFTLLSEEFGITFESLGFHDSWDWENRKIKAVPLLYLFLKNLRNREIVVEYILKERARKARDAKLLAASSCIDEPASSSRFGFGTFNSFARKLGVKSQSNITVPDSTEHSESGARAMVKKSSIPRLSRMKDQFLKAFRKRSYRRVHASTSGSDDEDETLFAIPASAQVIDLQDAGPRPRSRGLHKTEKYADADAQQPLLQHNYYDDSPLIL